jgi:hypothetical protein
LPGMVAHACNHSYLGGRDWEDDSSKRYQDPISINKVVVVANTCHSSYSGGIGRISIYLYVCMYIYVYIDIDRQIVGIVATAVRDRCNLIPINSLYMHNNNSV